MSGVARIFHANCPCGSPEIRIAIKKRLEHERYQIGHLLPCTVSLCVKHGIVAKPRRKARVSVVLRLTGLAISRASSRSSRLLGTLKVPIGF